MSRHRNYRNLVADEDYEDARADYYDDDDDDLQDGELYKAKYPGDGKYYNCEVLKIDRKVGRVKVMWVDYDRTEELDIKDVLLPEDLAEGAVPIVINETTAPGQYVMTVDKDKHAHLIGKKGAMVKELQTQTGARIIIPGQNDKSEIIKITGMPDQIEAAKEAISTRLESYKTDQALKYSRDRQGKLKTTEAAVQEWPALAGQESKVIEVIISKWCHRRLIGKQGTQLTEIRQLAAAAFPGDPTCAGWELVDIQIPLTGNPSETIIITAPGDKADNALEVITGKMAQWNLSAEIKDVLFPRGSDEAPAKPKPKAKGKAKPKPKPKPASESAAEPPADEPPTPPPPAAAEPVPVAPQPKPKGKPKPKASAKPAPSPAQPVVTAVSQAPAAPAVEEKRPTPVVAPRVPAPAVAASPPAPAPVATAPPPPAPAAGPEADTHAVLGQRVRRKRH